MAHTPVIVAGEHLTDIEAALDLFDLKVDECGELVMTATLPLHLSQCLTRALKTIVSQMDADLDSAPSEERHPDPMRELFRRIGEAQNR